MKPRLLEPFYIMLLMLCYFKIGLSIQKNDCLQNSLYNVVICGDSRKQVKERDEVCTLKKRNKI